MFDLGDDGYVTCAENECEIRGGGLFQGRLLLGIGLKELMKTTENTS